MKKAILTTLLLLFLLPFWLKAQNNEVLFSASGGVYPKAFPVALTCQNSSLHIRYTLNGSTPDQNSTFYTGPLMLNAGMCSRSDIYKIPISPENEFYLPESVTKGIVIRAAAFDNNENRVSPVVTQSYFVSSLGCDLHKLPVISICADSLALFDHDTGILVPGIFCDPENPTQTGNYTQSGIEWERVVNVEYYTNGNDGFNQTAGLRTHGGLGARRAQQKGLKLYAREEYGKKNFKFKIFEETDLVKFKHLVLKPFRNACTPAGVHDWLANQLAAELNMGFTASRPVALFLNGEYWGIYFLEEKADNRYVESHYGVDHDSVNIIASWGLLESGTSDSFYSLYYWLAEADLTDSAQYIYFSKKIDIPNFIDYLILELYSANFDWPINNVRCWQTIDNGPWHWIFYDGDCCFDKLDFDVYANATYTGPPNWSTAGWSTLFIRKLFENASFKNQFLTRLEQVNKKYFTYKHTKPYLNRIHNILKDEIPQQSKRFNNPQSTALWEQYIQELDNFLLQRETQFWIDTKNFFHIQEDAISSVICYPNPLHQGGKLNLLVTAESKCTVWVTIFDLNGRLISRQYFFLQEGENQTSLDTGSLSGVYLVKVGEITQKVVILGH